MSKINFEKANRMRAEGMTYEEIAKYFGVTKQYVHNYMNNPAFKNLRKRKNANCYKNIKYYGFKKLFLEDENLTIPKLVSCVFGHYSVHMADGILTRLMGGNEEVKLSVSAINNLLNISGLTYEEFFRKV